MKTIAVVNHKGGVGKTMTSQNLSAALALSNKKVLIVDMDPQCNLTNQMVQEITVPTISDLLNDDNIKVTPQEVKTNLYLIPGADSLDEDAINLARMEPEEASVQLKNILARLGAKFDFAIIDSAPGSSPLMVNAVVAADEIIVPISDAQSIDGASKLVKLMSLYDAKPLGHYLQTKYDQRLSVCKEINDFLLENNSSSLFHTKIRQTEALNQAACKGMDIFEYSKKSRGAEDYMSLAKEVIGKKQTSKKMPF